MSALDQSQRRAPADAPRYRNATNLTPLQTLRLTRGLTQKQVAAAVGTTESVVCLWETFNREPSSDYREGYAKVLGITVGELGRTIYAGREKQATVLPRARPRGVR